MAGGEGIGRAAGRGFAGGFFGCFGVLAALIVAGAAFVGWAMIRGGDQANAIRAGAAPPRDYLPFCAVGIARARAQFVGLEGADYRFGEAPQAPPVAIPLEVGCPAIAAAGDDAIVRIRVACDDPTQASCVQVVGAEVGARALARR